MMPGHPSPPHAWAFITQRPCVAAKLDLADHRTQAPTRGSRRCALWRVKTACCSGVFAETTQGHVYDAGSSTAALRGTCGYDDELLLNRSASRSGATQKIDWAGQKHALKQKGARKREREKERKKRTERAA